ncbi:hypothetical protein BBJ28_00023843 [Nothophytophthora sp. Chile5]|nr:hypothetical protein BBJ28_00023843 [Nothophytophthora sp. Chile5]
MKKISTVFADAPGDNALHVLVVEREPPQDEEGRLIQNLAAMRKEQALAQLRRQTRREQERLEHLTAQEEQARQRLARIPEHRKRDWSELNRVLLRGQDATASKAFSSVAYESLPKRFKPEIATANNEFYREMFDSASTPALDEAALNEGGAGADDEPSLEHVAYLFKHDAEPVKIGIQVKMEGDYVKANGVVDFLITRGKKCVCVVEAKNEQFEKGTAQSVLGMEVSAESNEEPVMYGIVTNYELWRFLKRTDEGVKEFTDCISVNPAVPF